MGFASQTHILRCSCFPCDRASGPRNRAGTVPNLRSSYGDDHAEPFSDSPEVGERASGLPNLSEALLSISTYNTLSSCPTICVRACSVKRRP